MKQILEFARPTQDMEGPKWSPWKGGATGAEQSIKAHWDRDGASEQLIEARWRALCAGVVVYIPAKDDFGAPYMLRTLEIGQ